MSPSDLHAADRTRWFTDARFGMFIHWGLYSLLGRGEWARYTEAIPPDEYHALAERFQPRYFDAADLPRPPGLGPLTRWSRALIQEARTADHPFNAGLMLESLVAQARQTLNSRH